MYIGVQQANEAIKLGLTMSFRPSAMAELSLCDFDIALNSAILYFCVGSLDQYTLRTHNADQYKLTGLPHSSNGPPNGHIYYTGYLMNYTVSSNTAHIFSRPAANTHGHCQRNTKTANKEKARKMKLMFGV